MSEYGALLLFALLLLVLGIVLIIANQILAVKRPDVRKYIPYECGLDPTGDARIPFRIRFYIIALIFLVFDVEVIFLYPWAIVFEHLKWFGFVEIFIFTVLLLVAYIYAWSEGGLTWD